MKTLKELREEREALNNRAEAIVAVATDESRDLKDDEKAEVDAILGVGKQGESTYKPGKIDAIDAEIARAEKIEAAMKARAAAAVPQGGPKPEPQRITIPATARSRGKLRAFVGADSEEQAYSAGQFYLSLAGNENARQWCLDHGIQFRNALGTGGTAGVLVPTPLETAIIRLVETYGVFRANARRWPMSAETDSMPRRTGGLTAYFTAQNPSSGTTESDPTFDVVGLVAKELCTATRISKTLSEDNVVALADLLTQEIALAFAAKEDACGFIGDGTSTYGGIVGIKNALAAGSEVTARAGNTAFSTLDLEDFEDMIGKLPQYPGIMPKWYIHSAGWAASMLRLQLAAGGVTAGDIRAGGSPTFLGYPVVFTQVMNSTLTAQTSTECLAVFGDLSMGAAFGDRVGVSVQFANELYIATNQIGVFGRERFDINVHERGSASAAGCIVQLNTPGS